MYFYTTAEIVRSLYLLWFCRRRSSVDRMVSVRLHNFIVEVDHNKWLAMMSQQICCSSYHFRDINEKTPGCEFHVLHVFSCSKFDVHHNCLLMFNFRNRLDSLKFISLKNSNNNYLI